MRRATALFLMLSILALSGNLYARGAKLVVQKKDGIQIRGELIAVKEQSLLLLEGLSGLDVSIDIKSINVIKIIKQSNALEGGLTGLFIGGVIGFIIGSSQVDEDGLVIISKSLAGGIGAAIGGVLCALIGIGIGSAIETEKTVQIEGRSEAEIKQILEDLRSKARVRDFQ